MRKDLYQASFYCYEWSRSRWIRRAIRQSGDPAHFQEQKNSYFQTYANQKKRFHSMA